MQEHTFVNSRIDTKIFGCVRHRKKVRDLETLTPAYKENNIAVVFSTNNSFALYLGVDLSSRLSRYFERKQL